MYNLLRKFKIVIPIKLILIISSLILSTISYLLLKFYNSGHYITSGEDGSLYAKRWYFRIGIFMFFLTIVSIVLFFIIPYKQIIVSNNKLFKWVINHDWLGLFVDAIGGYYIFKVLESISRKKQKTLK